MQVTIQPYYTVNSTVLLELSAPNIMTGDILLNILLDLPAPLFPALLKLLGTIENNYIISLPAALFSNPGILEVLLPALYLFTSLDKYMSVDSVTIPVLWNQPQEHASINTDHVKSFFNEQGIDDIQLPIFEYNDQAGNQAGGQCSFFICKTNKAPLIYTTSAEINIIAFIPSITDLTILETCRENTSVINPDENPKKYIESKICEREIRNWKKRALLYRDFIQLSKSVREQEYYEVLDWYKKEYEVLPRWYKRIGHIIKVMIGKRKFKSLFNDNLKKHKD